MDARSIIDIATTVSPALATILASVVVSILLIRKDLASVKSRIDAYDKLGIQAQLARMETDIQWIRAKLEKRI